MPLENLLEPSLSDNSIKVLERRYLKRDENGNVIENPMQMFCRIAKAVSLADLIYNGASKGEVYDGVKCEEKNGVNLILYNQKDSDENFKIYQSNLLRLKAKHNEVIERTSLNFYEMMAKLEFLPNSPTLMNAGRELGQLSACFTLPIDDSMDSIFKTLRDTAMIHKSGGGTGFSFSNLRPKNSVVKSTGGVASGPVSFMKVYDAATEAVKQGGTRRGANMGILRVDHPDILEFITCKENDKQINNFNISVTITDDFMKKLARGEEYDLIDPRTHKPITRINTREVFDLIVKQAHKNGEPGVIFIDHINHYNPTPKVGIIESTNPCGEQPLLPYESCNLGSINLGKFVKDKRIDYERLEDIVFKAVHFLDNVIDVNKYPIADIEYMTRGNRKIGLGVMGFADMLIELGIPYNSDDAVKVGEDVMNFISEKSKDASAELARERGAFPNFEKSIYNDKKRYKDERRLRNATTTTIAPTGTLSIIAGPCSSGIEPIFAISFHREVMDKDKLVEVNPLFEEIAKQRGFYSTKLMKKIAERGSIHNLDEQDRKKIPLGIQRTFVTAHDVSVEYHIKMQAAFQKHVDNAVSKTINMPHNATIEDVRKAYLLAYRLGCKGVTIYRDRSREEQVLVTGKKKERLEDKIIPRPRQETMVGATTKITTGCGNLYVTINNDEAGRPFELFTQMGKAGGCAASQLEAVGRLVSLALRSGIGIDSVIDQIEGIRCPSPSWNKGGKKVFSCADAIAKIIKRMYKTDMDNHESVEGIKPAMKHSREDEANEGNPGHGNIVGVCPDCGHSLSHEEGCVKCGSCGYSTC